MEGYFKFHWGGGVVFQMGWASFLSVSGCPMGSVGFDTGVFKKNCWMGGGVPTSHYRKTLKLFIKKGFLEEME